MLFWALGKEFLFEFILYHLYNSSFASWKPKQFNLNFFFAFIISDNRFKTFQLSFSFICFHIFYIEMHLFSYLLICLWGSRGIVFQSYLLMPTLVGDLRFIIHLSSKDFWQLGIFCCIEMYMNFLLELIGWQLNFLFLTYFFHTAAWIAFYKQTTCLYSFFSL